MSQKRNREELIRVLKWIAILSGIFVFILCILVIANYFQLKRTDPLNTPAMTILLEKLSDRPDDEQVKTEIRELDLLSRKAYFTSRWQIRTGGYLLFGGFLIMIIALKWIELLRPKIPPIPEPKQERYWELRMIDQRWIGYAGLVLVAGSLLLALLTYRELSRSLIREQSSLHAQADSVEKAMAVKTTPHDPDSGVKAQTFGSFADTSVSEKIKLPDRQFPDRREILANSNAFRGPDGNGIVFQQNFPLDWNGETGKNILWKTVIPLPGFNSPVVWEDRVFLTGANASERVVYCIDAETGKLRWTADVSDIPGTPAQVLKVNGETGFAAPSVTTDGRRVYAIFATGDLIALDMDGNQVWAKNLGVPKNHYGHSSSLIMYRDLLLVQYDQQTGSAVMAFSGVTGDLIWKTTRDVKVSWASPVLVHTGNRYELILVAEPYVVSYSPVDGKELWRITCIYGEVGPSVAYADGMVFAVNEYANLAAIRILPSPQIVWESSDYLSDIPSPVANQSYLFLVTSYGSIVCYQAKTGKEYWVKELEHSTYASPMLVDGKVYQLDKTGVMHIFLADSVYQSLGEPALGEGSVCTPAFSGGKIFIRGDKHVYCIGE